jgi:AcrR family transcriptional regulator
MMIKAAYRVLSERPAGPLPVGDVCAEAGLSTRSFYRHFKSKDELLLAMCEVEDDRVEADLTAAMSRAPNPRAALEAWVRFYLSLSFDPERRRRTLVMTSSEVTRASGYPAALARTQQRHRRPLVRTLEAGVADGSFPATRPDTDAVMIQDLVSSILVRHRDGVEVLDAETAFATVVEFLTRALGMRN